MSEQHERTVRVRSMERGQVQSTEELSITTEDSSESLKCSALVSCPGAQFSSVRKRTDHCNGLMLKIMWRPIVQMSLLQTIVAQCGTFLLVRVAMQVCSTILLT